ncbi:hypothetical protein G9G63_09270 [Paenibacillus sp. EKM202P]|uniref:hypothetical protein n=1 Tax=unclassified Paenibacillus TaxID=185978 RepID=UPI0013EBEB23|nr:MULTISPECIES: hypothetical protein [unclassified Paenibacillus]KAF6565339.1 hypothetical protein G9G63_09270 [Paenibacillus sp. EKM202P]KAF6569335.1 hypothetical protein G9G64_12820 [Paenibacillus sp. EKM207P]
MQSYYIGDLYRKLKEMEKEMEELATKIALAAYNINPDDELVNDYGKLREEFNRLMRMTVVEITD